MVKTLAQEAGLRQCDKVKVENSDYTNYGVNECDGDLSTRVPDLSR
jgi:hypothetical protein